jgi:putative SOS response-associated peptidase YedK
MCYHTEHKATAKELKKQYKATFPEEEKFTTKEFVNGFEHPLCPIITRQNPAEIQLYNWGLLPNWSKDLKIQNNTLNAKIETIHEKPSFKNYFEQRCIIPVTGLYEWEHKGKIREKNLIKVENKPIFSLAGLWNICPNPLTGLPMNTFTAVTYDGFVAILENEEAWLSEGKLLINTKTIWTSLVAPQLGLF